MNLISISKLSGHSTTQLQGNPLPEIISVSQVEGTNYLEIAFRINDADSSHVEAAMLGFVDGGTDFQNCTAQKFYRFN